MAAHVIAPDFLSKWAHLHFIKMMDQVWIARKKAGDPQAAPRVMSFDKWHTLCDAFDEAWRDWGSRENWTAVLAFMSDDKSHLLFRIGAFGSARWHEPTAEGPLTPEAKTKFEKSFLWSRDLFGLSENRRVLERGLALPASREFGATTDIGRSRIREWLERFAPELKTQMRAEPEPK